MTSSDPTTTVEQAPVQAGGMVVKMATLLSDIQILERIVRKDNSCIFISPLVDPIHQLGPSSLDLRLGTEIISMQTIASTHIDLGRDKDTVRGQLSEYGVTHKLRPGEGVVLHPGEFALANTLEFLKLPLDIAARLEGRSSVGRLGIQVHATAGFVDPGFEGTLTFELINSGKIPVRIPPGFRLGQMCFFRIDEVQTGYGQKENSKYAGYSGVAFTQIVRDPEIPEKVPDASD